MAEDMKNEVNGGSESEETAEKNEQTAPEAEQACGGDNAAEQVCDKGEEVKETPKEEKDTKKEEKDGKYKKENKQLSEKNKELEKTLAELQDRYLRLAAEYDNFRKRSAKEKEGIYSEACADCILAILPIADNLQRALLFPDSDKVVEGVRMTMTSFEQALKKLGVEEIETKTFDPSVHDAVMHVEDENFGENEIVEVFQKGYKKGEKVIRHAMVKVAN